VISRADCQRLFIIAAAMLLAAGPSASLAGPARSGGGAPRVAQPIARPPGFVRPPMDGAGHEPDRGRGHRGKRRGAFVNGYWWPYGDSYPDYTSAGYDGEEVGPAYAGPPEPPAEVEPICPEMLHWSAKLGRATRYRLCDDPGAASLTE
jgi:hypothetical protein